MFHFSALCEILSNSQLVPTKVAFEVARTFFSNHRADNFRFKLSFELSAGKSFKNHGFLQISGQYVVEKTFRLSLDLQILPPVVPLTERKSTKRHGKRPTTNPCNVEKGGITWQMKAWPLVTVERDIHFPNCFSSIV